MRRSSTGWRPFALLATAAVACAADPQSGDADLPAPSVEAAETAPAPASVPRASTAPAAPTAAPAAAPAPAARSGRRNALPVAPAAAATPAPEIPLEKLLQLPADTASDPVMAALLRTTSSQPAGEKTAARKVRLGVGVRTDSPIERPDLKREQADAAAEVDIRSDTTLRGGVRIERESSGGKASTRTPAPTIGLEKRF